MKSRFSFPILAIALYLTGKPHHCLMDIAALILRQQ